MEASRTIGIVGLGLIGGSLAVDLRGRGYASRFIGTDKNPLNAEAAGRLGLVDRVVPLEECIEESDIIVVSVPVSAAAGIIHTVLDAFKDKGYTDKIVMDVCSTKSQIAERLKYHPGRLFHQVPDCGTAQVPSLPQALCGHPSDGRHRAQRPLGGPAGAF